MNFGYWFVLVIFVIILQLPCFMSLLLFYPLYLIFRSRVLLMIPNMLEMYSLEWADKLFFNVTFIKDHIDSASVKVVTPVGKRYVYLANHQAYMDPLIARKALVSLLTQTLVTVTISYVKYVPLVGMNLLMLGIPFLHYDSSGKRISKGLVEMYTEYLKKNENTTLAMFPEGKRVFDGEFKLENIKTGGFVIAKNIGADIVPVYHNIRDRFDDVKKEYNTATKVYCIYGAPIEVNDRDINDVKKEYYNSMLTLRERIEVMKQQDKQKN